MILYKQQTGRFYALMPFGAHVHAFNHKIRQEFFQDYDATPILGDIDFAVTTKKSSEDEQFDQEYFF